MNKKGGIVFGIILFALFCGGVFVWINSNNNFSKSDEYSANRTSTSMNSSNLNDENASANDAPENNTANTANNANDNQQPPQIIEEQISTFSTKIYSSDSARQNNVQITCNTLNGTVIKNGDTFSFCNTVGQSSTSKGYQKADIFDQNGNKKKGLGGGNCQVSTTLYNAVLPVPTLVVTERHEHSNYVPYIQKGRDAAVAYGSYDLKFRNNTGNDIKINASTDGQSITTSIIALKMST